MKSTNEEFEILRKLGKNPNLSQRKLAKDLGFWFGKLNYCLKLLDKRVYKISKFQKKIQKKRHIFIFLLHEEYQ